MAKGAKLTVRLIDSLASLPRVYRVSDGGGLLLEVKPTGAKVWMVRLVVDGRRRDMGLGGYPTVTLAEARAAALEARRKARRGIDPIAQRRIEVEARRAAEAERSRTFQAVTEQCIQAMAPGWKNDKTAKLWRESLGTWVFPHIGTMPVAEVDRAAVMRAVQPVWTSRPATGKKVLQRVAAVCRYAAANGWRPNDNPADVRMLRHAGLPARAGGRKQPSLSWARVPAFMGALDHMPGLGAVALRLAILTALRSGEVRQARRSWLGFDGTPTLTVPGEVMKGKKTGDMTPHRVPLAPAAVETLLRAYAAANGTTATADTLPKLASLAGDALIFPSSTRRTPISDMTLSAAIRRMNADRPEGAPAPWRDPDGRDAVPHGFRASFSTWVDDTRPAEREAAEKALAHEVGNKVSAAYRRSDLFDRRIGLMAAWADHCVGEARVQAIAEIGGNAGNGGTLLTRT